MTLDYYYSGEAAEAGTQEYGSVFLRETSLTQEFTCLVHERHRQHT